MRSLLAGAAILTFAVSAADAASKNPIVEMNVQNRGKVTIELYASKAPKTVAHFLGLVRRKFYNGILVHRVEPKFVVQAGDPQTKTVGVNGPGIGGGGSGKNVPFEENNLMHEAGTVAMALSAPHSATGDSQFFINLKRNPHLDVDYCVFGKVTKGMDVVDKIQKGDKIISITEVKSSRKK